MLRVIAAVVAAAGFIAVVFFGPLALRAFSGGGLQTFPAPVDNQAVYDQAGALSAEVEQVLETQIDEIENRSGAEIAVYTRIEPGATNESNLADAQSLIDQWGIGRAGYDDGFAILLSFFDSTFEHGVLSTYAGGGFRAVYLNEAAQTGLRDDVIVPAIRQGAVEEGLIAGMALVGDAVTAAATSRLETYRVLNAMIGIPGGIIALLLTLGISYTAWRRHGDDPELVDSPSILMAGPPAAMTPPLATVLREGRASQHTINTTLVDLAGRGLISFRNLDQVKKVKSDSDPDPLVDPAITVVPAPDAHSKRLPPGERDAYAAMEGLAIGGELNRERLWRLNDELSPVKEQLEREAVRLGWLTQRPTPIITRWMVIAAAEIVVGIGLVFLGYTLPMSGLTLLGAAVGVGGIGTAAFGSAMSQRTPQGAYVDAMLKAYRRTLQKTLEQARSMAEVVEQPEVRVLADTPDKAVVWGFALGLHAQVATVIERGLAAPAVAGQQAYFPVWLGTSSPSSSGSFGTGGAAGGLTGLFSGGGTPDIGGMFSALGSVGSSPASSSGSGGGFGGGGSSGGGGGSSGF